MNHYAEAIELLKSSYSEAVPLIFEIAKYNPKSLVDAARRLNLIKEPSWKDKCKESNWQIECKALINAGKKIDAIKRCRELTDMGLKEAKEAVEAL